MEVNRDLASSPNNAIAVESLRQFINRPIIAIFSENLENPTTEQMLCSLLESLLKRSSTLIPILIPPCSNGTTNETLQQYAAFTTWLFGTMFYLTSMPSSNVVLSNSIEVQACMLRILSRHHSTMFQTISSEYLNIFDEISEFYLNAKETEEITLSKFHTERNIIQDLDLTPFPAKIKLSNVPSVYTSLLKIIMKTGVSVWDQVKLWDKATTMIVKSSPDLQVEAFRLCIEIMKNCTVHDWELMAKVTYSLEIVKSLPTWINSNQLPVHLSQLAETWIHLIQLLPVSFNVMELCFQIIDFIASEFVTYNEKTEAIKKLMEAACCKIKQYLIEEPKPCTVLKATKLLAYFVHCSAIIDIFMRFVFIDIKRAAIPNEAVLATEISEKWKLLRKELISFVQAEKFTEVLYIIKASSLLQLWLEEQKFQVKLYENDLNIILKILMQNLNSDKCQNEQINFQILINLMAHNESNKVLLQSILALPFTQTFKGSMDISQKMVQRAKSLDVETMSECLETLCAHGNGKERLKLLRVCILNGETQIAVTAVLNSVLLLNDADIKLEDLCQYVLNTALSSTKVEIQEAFANVLGQVACISSGKGRIISVPLHLTERRILDVFLITILHPNSLPTAVASAVVTYQDIANFLNVSPKALYIRYRKDFLELIMKSAVNNYIYYAYNMATTVHRVAKCIGYEGSRQLLRKDGHYAICFLIALIVEVPKASALLDDIAELINMDIKQMLEEYFPYIYSYAFLNIPLRIAECLRLITNITKTSLEFLTKQSFMGIFEELMLNFYESPKGIIGFLEIISEYNSNQRGNFGTQEQVASYLNLRLHGILVNFDIKLGPKSDEHTQQSALASLAVLIRYMGATYLTPLRYKILATLRTSLGFKRPGFPRLVCDAWDAFIHNIAIEDLGPLFPTICVSLMSLQKIFPEKVNNDMEVSTHISDIVKAHILQAKPEGFNANLELWLKRITHETDEVRIRALKHLQTFLEEHRSELNKMILSETDVHPLIVELLDTLLIGCQDKDESIRLCYGECLGELGAIEPSLLPRRIISREFCDGLDSLVVAKGCYESREYHRALMYLEQHMAFSNKGLSELTEGGLLAKIYAQLDDPDGVSGILATQDQSPTLQQLVLAHEVNGQLQDAATCYERLAQKKDLKHTYLQGMIQCYLDLDHPFTAKHISEGLLSNRPELEPLITEHELFWRLGHFSRFEETSQKNIKHVLLDDLIKGTKPDLLSLKKNLVSLLEDASRPGVYQQSYSYIMKLHILNEFDKAVSMMLNNAERLPAMLEEWEKRGQLLRASRGLEFVLSMRRATLDLAVQLQQKIHNTENSMLKQEIGRIWLKSAKIARKAGLHQQAYMHILSASDSCPPQPLYIEQAQLYWQKGCQEDAFITLNRSFLNCFKPVQYYKQLSSGDCNEERKQYAKAKLLFAKYNDETLNVDTDGCIINYKEAIEVWRGWEKSWVSCAQYYDTIVERMSEEDKDRNRQDLQVHMMNFYGKSLQYGCKYIHHSMPKMLTIWLDHASRATITSDPVDVVRLRQDRLLKMTQIMEVYHSRLPTFMWLTAFSQLVSRICHPCLQSSYPARQKRCQEILNHAQLKTSVMSKLIKDFHRLWERLIELSNKTISDSVVPLNEECGLIEWVPNLVGFRPTIMNLYKERGIAYTNKELKTMLCSLKDPLEKKRQMFLEKLLPRHPPVFADWFRIIFPDPYGWYEARTAYIRTTAVMSMVGYILGLGDRHGENILFDSKCGDCVHVDFNCLFNRAVEHIKNIEQRLKGLIRYPGRKAENIALHLSVEGQTNHLILEATNIDNLCQMYYGWGAYL
ncbi:serine threonine-protein kinase atr-like protein [Lasius niger]|uniref:Serine/threonine-protein kinase ATR n=1 Tax=Lasius niger TaxID=67767 RepID=A0A0J7NWS2_LASNI|nr:serine threonine-protein kinase atr-like protein [Lasius niger]